MKIIGLISWGFLGLWTILSSFEVLPAPYFPLWWLAATFFFCSISPWTWND